MSGDMGKDRSASAKPYRETLTFDGGCVSRGHSLRAHPADGTTATVDVGGGAFMSIKDPTPETGLVWTLTWGNHGAVRYTVASLLQSYDYLLHDGIGEGEARRRLTLLRRAWKALAGAGKLPPRDHAFAPTSDPQP